MSLLRGLAVAGVWGAAWGLGAAATALAVYAGAQIAGRSL